MDKTQLKSKIAEKKRRRDLYIKREEFMLSESGVQSYGVGSRNLQRYSTALSEVCDSIRTLEREIDELERALFGGGARRAFAVTPQDW